MTTRQHLGDIDLRGSGYQVGRLLANGVEVITDGPNVWIPALPTERIEACSGRFLIWNWQTKEVVVEKRNLVELIEWMKSNGKLSESLPSNQPYMD